MIRAFTGLLIVYLLGYGALRIAQTQEWEADKPNLCNLSANSGRALLHVPTDVLSGPTYHRDRRPRWASPVNARRCRSGSAQCWDQPLTAAMLGWRTCFVAAPILALAANIVLVVVRAESTAAGRAYCIQRRSDALSSYQPVQALLDLSIARLWTPYRHGGGSGDFQWTLHGVLVAQDGDGRSWYNWSYRSLTFVPISDRSRSLLDLTSASCTPAPSFALGLPLY